MNKLTRPRWWEALLLLLPIVGTIVTLLILIILPIGVFLAKDKNIVQNWPLIQGMVNLSPVISTIGLIGSSYLFSFPPIGNMLVIIAVAWVASYVIVGIAYNKAVTSYCNRMNTQIR